MGHACAQQRRESAEELDGAAAGGGGGPRVQARQATLHDQVDVRLRQVRTHKLHEARERRQRLGGRLTVRRQPRGDGATRGVAFGRRQRRQLDAAAGEGLEQHARRGQHRLRARGQVRR